MKKKMMNGRISMRKMKMTDGRPARLLPIPPPMGPASGCLGRAGRLEIRIRRWRGRLHGGLLRGASRAHRTAVPAIPPV